jgi:hypothetical protein
VEAKLPNSSITDTPERAHDHTDALPTSSRSAGTLQDAIGKGEHAVELHPFNRPS